jgi:hypothetical protein
MRKLVIQIVFSVFAISFLEANGQTRFTLQQPRPYEVIVSNQVTTVLVFPAPVVDIDRGKSTLLASKVSNTSNVLKIKASGSIADTTSLHVFTADGLVNTFVVYMQPTLPTLTHILVDSAVLVDSAGSGQVKYQHIEHAPAEWDSLAAAVHEAPDFLRVKRKRYRVSVRLAGIYSSGNSLFYKLEIRNRGKLSYCPVSIQTYRTDQKVSKKTSFQQIVVPIRFQEKIPQIPGTEKVTWVMAISREDLPGDKRLSIELHEANGGRPLQLTVPVRKLFSTITLK